MDKQTLKSAMELNAHIESLTKIKSALEHRSAQGTAQPHLIVSCIMELQKITCVEPVRLHLADLVTAALVEKQIALDNL